jgi:hypothetical protein
LRKLPFFKFYRNDRALKLRYFLENEIQIDYTENPSMFELAGQHCLQRHSDALILKVNVAYRPELDSLLPQERLAENSKRKESMTLSDYNEDRKISVYTFYDPDENFHFLSSD